MSVYLESGRKQQAPRRGLRQMPRRLPRAVGLSVLQYAGFQFLPDRQGEGTQPGVVLPVASSPRAFGCVLPRAQGGRARRRVHVAQWPQVSLVDGETAPQELPDAVRFPFVRERRSTLLGLYRDPSDCESGPVRAANPRPGPSRIR
jgi:hypothetical protein